MLFRCRSLARSSSTAGDCGNGKYRVTVMSLTCIESQFEIGERKAAPRTVISLVVVKARERKVEEDRTAPSACAPGRVGRTVFDDAWSPM